jgi:DNA-binding HxlR family transcriptional regulator
VAPTDVPLRSENRGQSDKRPVSEVELRYRVGTRARCPPPDPGTRTSDGFREWSATRGPRNVVSGARLLYRETPCAGTMTPARASRPRPSPATAVARAPEVPWDEIDQCFREFREAAVRLVERVNDLMAPSLPPHSAPPKDVRLVRSVFGKWSMEVLVALHTTPSAGFEELRRSLPGISPRVLSLKLKSLEQHRMVRREIIDARPPRVRYTLTDQGWTVAWLSDPVLLFLEQTGVRERTHGADESTAGASSR